MDATAQEASSALCVAAMIIKGNHFCAGYYARTGTRPESPPEIVLTEDSQTGQGNFVLSHWTLNSFKLTLAEGNCRRMYWRQTDQDPWALLNPAALPQKVINTNSKYWDIATIKRLVPSPLALITRDCIETNLGVDGLAAWDWVCQTLLANPTMTQALWEIEFAEWANKIGIYAAREGKINPIDPLIALDRIVTLYVANGVFSPPADKFEAMAAKIRALPLEAWRGAPVVVAQELS